MDLVTCDCNALFWFSPYLVNKVRKRFP